MSPSTYLSVSLNLWAVAFCAVIPGQISHPALRTWRQITKLWKYPADWKEEAEVEGFLQIHPCGWCPYILYVCGFHTHKELAAARPMPGVSRMAAVVVQLISQFLPPAPSIKMFVLVHKSMIFFEILIIHPSIWLQVNTGSTRAERLISQVPLEK